MNHQGDFQNGKQLFAVFRNLSERLHCACPLASEGNRVYMKCSLNFEKADDTLYWQLYISNEGAFTYRPTCCCCCVSCCLLAGCRNPRSHQASPVLFVVFPVGVSLLVPLLWALDSACLAQGSGGYNQEHHFFIHVMCNFLAFKQRSLLQESVMFTQ